MGSVKKISFIAIIAMAILSFTNLFNLEISSICIFIGIAFFFINRAIEKQPMKGSGLDFSSIVTNLKDRKIWFWIILPIIVNAINVTISSLFLPEYIEYETARASAFVSVELSLSSILLFFVFALGEEIAWRAFFQQQLSKVYPIIPVLIISSFLFTLGHFESGGNMGIVIYGLVFTFINSMIYGLIFHKTKNAWISTIAHYAANMFEVILYLLL